MGATKHEITIVSSCPLSIAIIGIDNAGLFATEKLGGYVSSLRVRDAGFYALCS